MRLPRVRFTVRRLMVATAIAAGLAGGVASSRRWCGAGVGISREVAYLGLQAGMEEENARTAGVAIWFDRASDPDRPERAAPRYRRRAEFYGRLRAKYERAARYPWLPRPPRPARARVRR